MWTRATWHECADELEDLSQRFRDAFWGRHHGSVWPRHADDEAEMLQSSRDAVKMLRAIALAVRSEQDFALVPDSMAVVGAIKRRNAVDGDADEAKRRHGYEGLLDTEGYEPLTLREALNRIAHADPRKADYYVGPLDRCHDLLLFGDNRGERWFAAVSMLELPAAVRALPDVKLA